MQDLQPWDKPMNNWPQQTTELSALLRSLRGSAPGVMKAFAGIAKAATVSKALDGKTKELIALGISVAVRCDDCIAFHAKAAVDHGATRDEVSETLEGGDQSLQPPLDPLLRHLNLHAEDIDDLKAFLDSLSADPYDQSSPAAVPSGLKPGG